MTPLEIKALKMVKMPLRGVITDRELISLRARNAARIAEQRDKPAWVHPAMNSPQAFGALGAAWTIAGQAAPATPQLGLPSQPGLPPSS
jgi:hypothetical protein